MLCFGYYRTSMQMTSPELAINGDGVPSYCVLWSDTNAVELGRFEINLNRSLGTKDFSRFPQKIKACQATIEWFHDYYRFQF